MDIAHFMQNTNTFDLNRMLDELNLPVEWWSCTPISSRTVCQDITLWVSLGLAPMLPLEFQLAYLSQSWLQLQGSHGQARQPKPYPIPVPIFSYTLQACLAQLSPWSNSWDLFAYKFWVQAPYLGLHRCPLIIWRKKHCLGHCSAYHC